MPRLAVLNRKSCHPRRCSSECYTYCPGVRMGEETVVIDEQTGAPTISEALCTGCGICSHKCPFHALTIVNLPSELEGRCIHRFGVNGFALYELPIPRPGKITGLVGQNGIGKTTALDILAGGLSPNLGGSEAASREAMNEFFRGSELQAYFGRRIKAAYKPQLVDRMPGAVKGKTGELLEKVNERGIVGKLVEALGLEGILDRDIKFLSGGELQALAIAATTAREADVYCFDEPSSHLDVYQRLNSTRAIRELAEDGKAVLVVEHDLAMLDYLCDYVHVMYGTPMAYGVVSSPRGVRTGINVFLDGYMREENVKFRSESIRFEVRPPSKARVEKEIFSFPKLTKHFKGFGLEVSPGSIRAGEIVGVIGPNAIGKTTFVRMLAGGLKPTQGRIEVELSASYKPQYPEIEFEGTVEGWLHHVLGEFDPSFKPEVLQPLGVTPLLERATAELSGGELQRVVVASCLGRPSDLYLLDEPSAYLDVEQRLGMARAIKRLIENRGASAFVVDHDLLNIDYISDRLLVFRGEPGESGETLGPLGKRDGMNIFLRELGVTFRRDPQTGRPRVNKPGSALDREQRERGEYFYLG